MFLPRINCCLVSKGAPDRYVSIRESLLTKEIIFLGKTYKKSQYRTEGGWRVYREVSP